MIFIAAMGTLTIVATKGSQSLSAESNVHGVIRKVDCCQEYHCV